MLAEDDPVKMQMDIVDEQIDAVGQAFLGLTLGCARCHDHKFDPIPTADYYGLAGIFISTKTMDNFGVVARWHERPLTTPDAAIRLAQLEQRIADKKAEIGRLDTEARRRLQDEARRQLARYVEAAEELRRQPPLQSVMSDPKKSQGALVREAEEFQRGNVKKDFTGYGEKIGVIYNAGPLPNFAEYDLNVPAAGSYQLEIRYAAAASRPIEVSLNGNGHTELFSNDEGIRANASYEATAALQPAFNPEHSITAGNASQISDGAAAVLLMSLEKAKELGLKPRARIRAQAVVGTDPVLMLEGPIPGTAAVLKKAGLDIKSIDLFEVNEAFASVVLAWEKETGADINKTNVNGGAIAVGHPLGASGAILMNRLLFELERRDLRYGLETMCCGGGIGTATIIDRVVE